MAAAGCRRSLLCFSPLRQTRRWWRSAALNAAFTVQARGLHRPAPLTPTSLGDSTFHHLSSTHSLPSAHTINRFGEQSKGLTTMRSRRLNVHTPRKLFMHCHGHPQGASSRTLVPRCTTRWVRPASYSSMQVTAKVHARAQPTPLTQQTPTNEDSITGPCLCPVDCIAVYRCEGALEQNLLL